MKLKISFTLAFIAAVLAVSGCTNPPPGTDFFRGNISLEGSGKLNEKVIVTFLFSPVELLKSGVETVDILLKIPPEVIGGAEWNEVKISENRSYVFRTEVIPVKTGLHRVEMMIKAGLPTGSQETSSYVSCIETKEGEGRILESC